MTVTMDVDIVSGNANVGKERKRLYEQQRKDIREQQKDRREWENDTVNGRRNA